LSDLPTEDAVNACTDVLLVLLTALLDAGAPLKEVLFGYRAKDSNDVYFAYLRDVPCKTRAEAAIAAQHTLMAVLEENLRNIDEILQERQEHDEPQKEAGPQP
jgi:hypothetical protein